MYTEARQSSWSVETGTKQTLKPHNLFAPRAPQFLASQEGNFSSVNKHRRPAAVDVVNRACYCISATTRKILHIYVTYLRAHVNMHDNRGRSTTDLRVSLRRAQRDHLVGACESRRSSALSPHHRRRSPCAGLRGLRVVGAPVGQCVENSERSCGYHQEVARKEGRGPLDRATLERNRHKQRVRVGGATYTVLACHVTGL